MLTLIAPGSTLGILGGGQLGRMTAMAARSLGYGVAVLDPDPACAARYVSDRCITAAWDDEEGAARLARGVDVVTLEIERVSLSSLEAAARFAPTRPSAAVMGIVQDRIRQKTWLRDSGFPVGDFRAAASVEELASAVRALGADVFVKAASGGYDGRGQIELRTAHEADAAWRSLGSAPVIVEKRLSLDAEISVMVARRSDGRIAVFPAALNRHEQRVLAWSVIPAPIDDDLARRASELACDLAAKLAVEGLVAIEMFIVGGDVLLVNELAPRPHNSFHATERACATSQFEQQVRAVCGLPLGSVELVRPAAIVNLLGDLWLGQGGPDFEAALADPSVRLHLYGKREARRGRKMGHLSAIGATPHEAVTRAREALRKMVRPEASRVTAPSGGG